MRTPIGSVIHSSHFDDAITQTFKSSKRRRNEAEKHPCTHREIPHKAEEHPLRYEAHKVLEHEIPDDKLLALFPFDRR